MTQGRAKPSKDQLYDAYRSGVNLEGYLRLKTKYKLHEAAVAIARMGNVVDLYDSTDGFGMSNDRRELTDKAIDQGISLIEIGETYTMNVDLREYFRLRMYSETSHEEAIEALTMGIKSYPVLVGFYHLTHSQLVSFHKEYEQGEGDFSQYAVARVNGVSKEDAVSLSGNPCYWDGELDQLLKVGVSAQDAIDALKLDIDRPPRETRKSSAYVEVRETAIVSNFPLSHEQAMEVAQKAYWPAKYLELREKGVAHETALLDNERWRPRPHTKRTYTRRAVKTV
jgi:hypothetical protein